MNLENFTEKEMESIVDNVFEQEKNFHSVEEAYQCLTQLLYEACLSADGEPQLMLSRVYHSFNYYLLSPSQQQTALEVWGDKIEDNSKILVLLGTYGKEPAWRDRKQSKGHRAILLNPYTLENIPMVSRLIQQIGFDTGLLLGKSGAEMGFEGLEGTFGVFYVSPAIHSPYIPAQDFVTKYEIKSVIGTGVMLPQGDICVYIGFSRVNIDNKIAANIAPLMSIFWQKAFPLLAQHGMFT